MLTARQVRAAFLTKHAGPIHPGTGTDQSVHGGNGGAKSTKTYYHLTDDPNFELRDIKPDENYLAIFYNEERGIYLTDNPEHWVNGYGYVRPFLVELELTGETKDLGRWGGEHFVRSDDFSQLKVKRVIPLDEYAREHYGLYGWIEGSLDEDAVDVGNIKTFPDYRYTGDVRDFTPEEVARHKQRAREAWVARGHGTTEEAKDLFKHASPVHPGTGTDQSVHGSGNKMSPSDVIPTMTGHTTSGKPAPNYDALDNPFDWNSEYRRAWASLPELEGDRTYWTRPSKIEHLQSELDRLNRRGQRYLGIADSDALRIVSLDRSHAHTASDGRIIAFQAIRIDGTPPEAPGFEFIAKIEHLQNEDGSYTNILKSTPGFEEQIPVEYRNAGPNCDVCHRNIYRKETFLVREIATGKITQAGRDDLAIYTGFNEADQLANYTSSYADFVSQLNEGNDDFGGGGSGGALTYSSRDALAVTASLTRQEGFTPASSYDGTPTKVMLGELLSRGRVPEEMRHLLPGEQDYDKAEKVIEWLSSLEDEDLANDYMWNLKVAATNPYGVDDRQFGLVASAVNAYDREMGLRVERARQVNLDAESDWVGTIKERRDFTGLTVSRRNSFEGNYGTTYVYEFIDPDNNNLVWFASNPLETGGRLAPEGYWEEPPKPVEIGDKIDLKATIKDHKTDTYNNRNRKQTVITRGSLLAVHGQEEGGPKKVSKARADLLVKHASPIHPGTGTDQSVHGGGGTTTLFDANSTTTVFNLPGVVEQDKTRARLATLDRLITRSKEELVRLRDNDEDSDKIARVEDDLAGYETEHWTLSRYLDTPQLFEGAEVRPLVKPGKVKEITSFSGRSGIIHDESPVEEARGVNTDPYSIFEAELELPDGSTYRSVVDTVGESYGDVIVHGRILDGDGNEIGSFERQLSDDRVHNNSFFLAPNHQGQGIGSLFWSHWEQELANAGFEYMTVSTTAIGSYAWVVAGYEGGEVDSWMEDLRENYLGEIDGTELESWLDDKWGEAFGREVSGGYFMDDSGYQNQPAWVDYASPELEDMVALASDPRAMQEFAESNLNDYGEELGVEELQIVAWDFDPDDFRVANINDPDVRDQAIALLDEYDSMGYVEPLDIASLGAGTSEHIGKEILLRGPGWSGEKDISWLRETVEKALRQSYLRLWAEWARTNPAAIENDSPEWWAAVRDLIDRQKKVVELIKHFGPGPHPGTGTDQAVHAGRVAMDRLPGTDWSEHGVRHPSVPDRDPYSDWSPVMTEEEADAYLERHGLDALVYGAHATGDPRGVLSEGFITEEVSSWVGWGDGLYLVQEDADDYYESASQYAEQGLSLRIAAGFENLLEVHTEDPSKDVFEAIRAGVADVGVEFHWNGPGTAPLDHYKIITEWAKIPWNPAWDGSHDSRGSIGASDAYPGLSKVLIDHGYDGLQINAPHIYPMEWFSEEEVEYDDPNINYIRFSDDLMPAPGTGGSQTIVFDPQHAVIIGRTDFTKFERDEIDLEEKLERANAD